MASLWKFAVASSANQDKKTSASEVEAARNEKQRAKTISNKRDGENVSEPKRLAHADRYQHDLNQAIAMRGGDSHLRASTNNLSSFKAESLSKDIELGYIGLDEADAFRIAGKRKESLKLYELSLELLIRVLKTLRAERGVDCDTKLDPEINPIESRVKAALSDAERVKAMLESNENGLGAPQNFRQSPSPEPKCLPPSPESNSLVSLSSALSSALRRDTARQTRKLHSSSVDRLLDIKASGFTDELSRTILSDFLVDADSLHRTTWGDISGLEAVKQALQESAILPLMRPDLFSGLRRPKNILLFGPPGTGKTMLVRAVAQESGSILFCVTAATATSKWMGEAEKLVRALFAIARRVAPSLIFIDEVDSLLSARKSDGEHEASRRLKTEFMIQMDGVANVEVDERSSNMLVLACTNCPWDVDSAVLRRFPRRLFVPLPDEAARRGLLSSLLKKAGKHSLTSGQIGALARRLDGFSCSDMSAIASEASFGPLRSLGGLDLIRKVSAKDIRPICIADFETAISQATKSVTPSLLQRYDGWMREISS
jgi:SpoVK/Ycf46/Vps4 family AAA+-type ATPase